MTGNADHHEGRMSTPIATVTALGAALTLGISSVADHRSTKRVQTHKALSPRIVADLVRQPLWLAALCANVVGFALQVVALASGSIALVQPLLVCDLIFAVLIARYLSVRAHRPHPPTGRVFAGIAATTLGVAGFLAIGQPSAGRTYVSPGFAAPLAVGLILAAMGCLVAATRNRNLQSLALAVACGVAYGTAAFAIKLVTLEFSGGPAEVFSNWPIYFVAVAGPAGFILNQDAFQRAKFISPVQGIITAADPLISIALGIAFLGVRLHGSPAAITGEVVSLLLMTAGIVATAYQAPQAGGPASTQAKNNCVTGSLRPHQVSGWALARASVIDLAPRGRRSPWSLPRRPGLAVPGMASGH
jgi:hypothetical protein